MAPIIQVTFDPTLWAAGSGTAGTPGSNGYNCAQVWLDNDGTTCWAFEYFGSGFKRFNLSDGSTVHEDAMFGTPGFQSAHYWYSRESTGVFWQQDDAGNYYTMFDGSSGYFPLQKFQIGSGTVGNLLNGYCTDPTTFDINGGLTPTLPTFDQIEDFRVFKSGGVHYIAMIGNRVAVGGTNHGVFYIINADTLTFVGSWVAPTVNEDGWQVFQDSAGDIWCATQGPTPTPSYINLVKWHPADGATGTTLNFTTPGTGVHTILGSTLGSAFASSGFIFATYVAANNSLWIGQSISQTGPSCTIDLSTFAVSNVVPDNLSYFENGILDDAQACMDNGVQLSGVLAIPGDQAGEATQIGGIINLIDPTTNTLLSTTNVTTAIVAQGGLIAPPFDHAAVYAPCSTIQYNGSVAVVAYQYIGSPVYIVPMISLPTVTTQAASSITQTSATANGDITNLGGDAQCILEGFVYDTTTHSLPGNVVPGSSGYAFNVITVGAFPVGTFTEPLTSLIPGTPYFMRAVVQNSAGYSYGNEVTFTSIGLPAPTIFAQVTPSSITLGQSATLSWASVNATSMTIDNGIGSVAVNGSMVVTPTASMWYHFTATGPGGTAHYALELKVYQAISPSYIMARNLNQWQDMNGPYANVDVTIGSITLSQPGESLVPVQHIIVYADAAGVNGTVDKPSVSFLPNEIFATASSMFIPVPEDQIVPEPPTGAVPSTSLQQLRFPINMVNSLTSQFMHHLQIKVAFPTTNAPHTLKAIAIKSDQD